jgi:hypothetical protein
MAQFPVEYARKDSESLVEAINYALSGPSGLGQNFNGFSDSFTAWLRGNVRQPSTVAGYTTPAHGASTGTEITVSDPGSVRQNDANIPSKIVIGQYVYGTNIGAGAQVSVDYDEINTPWLVPLTVANTGAVQGAVSFYNLAPTTLYVAPISIGTIAWLNSRTILVTFATAQPTAPFEIGTLPLVFGSPYYNGLYTGPGVVACDESTVTLQSSVDIPNLGTTTGGSIKVSNTIQPPAVGVDPGFPSAVYWNTTDCVSNVTVNGNLDRVFISAQIDNTITYTASATTTLEYTVAVNRFVAVPALTLTNTEFQYFYDQTVALQTYQYSLSVGTATLPVEETVFTNVIDNPGSAYYLYRLDLLFRVINDTGACEVTQSKLGNRSISVQVVKF